MGEFNAAGGGDIFCHASPRDYMIFILHNFLVKVDAKPMLPTEMKGC